MDDLPCTVPLRTAWDVAALEGTSTAVGVLDAMLNTGLLDVADLHGLVRAGAGRWRCRRVRTAVDLVDGRSESPPESWVRVACLRALPAPIPQFDVVGAGWRVIRLAAYDLRDKDAAVRRIAGELGILAVDQRT